MKGDLQRQTSSGNRSIKGNDSKQPAPASGGVPRQRRGKMKVPFQMLVLLAGLLLCIFDVWYMIEKVHNTLDEQKHPIDNLRPNNAALILKKNDTNEEAKDPEAKGENGQGREPILALLTEAGIDVKSLDEATVESLPTWEQVTNLYGHVPQLIGLEKCRDFRENGDPAEHFLAPAGTFNTGTFL
jgi:hypothetical protein